MRRRPVPPLIFLHLPKTAGTTFNAILARQYAGLSTHAIRSDAMAENMQAFRDAPQTFRHGIRLLQGHQCFGLHDSLSPGARYITVVRDPVARVISHYHYVKSVRHPKFIGAIEAAGLDLLRYVMSGVSGELENGQTRWISGVLDDRPLDQNDYEQAILNLERHFDWVGVTERFDESLIDLALLYGWPRVYYRRRNVGVRKDVGAVPDEVAEAIRSRNRFDLRLHEYAIARMDCLPIWRVHARRAAAQVLRGVSSAGSRVIRGRA